jgi:hypothetical protein
LQNDDECTDVSHEVLLIDIFAQQLWNRPLERYRNGVHVHALFEEFWIEINGWLTSYNNLVGHKNLIIDREPLVRFEKIDAKWLIFDRANEMIIESYGHRQVFEIRGELVRHTYTHSTAWNNLSSFNESSAIKDMKWWWQQMATQLKVQVEVGDIRLKYREIYLTKVLWETEFEKFERKWKFVFLPRRVIVKSYIVFKVGPRTVEMKGTRRTDAHLWEFDLYFLREYVRMIVQFYEMFDAKCWYYPESIDLRDRRCIVMADEQSPRLWKRGEVEE